VAPNPLGHFEAIVGLQVKSLVPKGRGHNEQGNLSCWCVFAASYFSFRKRGAPGPKTAATRKVQTSLPSSLIHAFQLSTPFQLSAFRFFYKSGWVGQLILRYTPGANSLGTAFADLAASPQYPMLSMTLLRRFAKYRLIIIQSTSTHSEHVR
jgi:hypothetical protein